MIRSKGVLVLLLFSAGVASHDSSVSYIKLEPDTSLSNSRNGDFQWDIAARDLDLVAPLDLDGNGDIMGHEVIQSADDVTAYLGGALVLSAGGLLCTQSFDSLGLRTVQGRGYLSLKGRYQCNHAAVDGVRYGLFKQANPSHQLLLKLGADGLTQRLVNDASLWKLRDAHQSLRTLFASFVIDGMQHVAGGLDHVLFLVLLLVPAVLVVRQGRWLPAADLNTVLKHTAWLSAAFALGHGISLSLAVLAWLQPPSAWVELGIAASIVVVALNNVCTRYHIENSALALLFGFVHGFGFAAVLSGQSLSSVELFTALLGFNMGIELFQLALVMTLVPLLFYTRLKSGYVRYFLKGSAALCSLVALQLLYTRLLLL